MQINSNFTRINIDPIGIIIISLWKNDAQKGCRRRKTRSNFSLVRCSNFRRHGKGNQIQSRENPVCSCVTRRGTHSFPPDSHFVVQTRIQGMPLLDLIVSSVGSTPRGEHAADLASRRERSCRWNTFKRVFLREKMVADGSLDLMKLSFDETREEILCLIAVIYLLLALNRSTDPLFAMKFLKKENKIVSRWFLFPNTIFSRD